jgi:CRISPR-associated protein Csb2
MTVLELSFPAGRYHATPWGRHVNEGVVEWPPSPWRILRALIATWYLKAREVPEPTLRGLVGKLSVLPRFRLPRAVTSHTRHYMPTKGGDKTKVFDTFIQIEEGSAILVAWDSDLTPGERAALQTLASRLGYFGRAEALVVGRVLDGITGIEANSSPLPEGAPLPAKTELVRLLAPMLPEAYELWRGDFLASQAAPAEGTKKKGKKSKTAAGAEIPADLFAALHADTGDLQAAGWNLPPGSQFANYARPENPFVPAPRPRPRRKGPLPAVARYAVVSTVAPRITQAISIGDRVHRWLCSVSDGTPAPVFTGLDAAGKPLADHRHAHIFCEASGPRDAVTHLTIWAPMGFDEAACLALRKLNKVWGHGGHDLRLVLHGIGQPEEFVDCLLFGPARAWRSATPFVPTRHAKTFRDGRPKVDPDNGWQEGSAGHDLLRLLAMRPGGAGATIKQLPERDKPFAFGTVSGQRALRSLQFQTRRSGGDGRRGSESGSAFIVTFSKPVHGPLALGYGGHFGLGLFVPAAPDAKAGAGVPSASA